MDRTGRSEVMDIPDNILCIEGIEDVYRDARRNRTHEEQRKLNRFLVDKNYEKQRFFKFNGLSWREITKYYDSVSTSKTSGTFRLLKEKTGSKVFIRDPTTTNSSTLSILKLYDSTEDVYDQQFPSSELERVKDNEKSMFDVGRFQVKEACDYPKLQKYYYYSDIIQKVKNGKPGHGPPFKGYYVICGPHMCFERCYQALFEYFKEKHRNPDDEFTTYFHLDVLSVHRDMFEDEADDEFGPEFLHADFHKAIASFDKVLVVLDCWKNPTTFLSTFAIWQLYALVAYNVDFDIVVQKSKPTASNGSEVVSDRNEIYKMQSEVPTECSLYPLQFGNGDPSSSDSVRSLYQLVEDEDFSTYGQKDTYFKKVLTLMFDEFKVDFNDVKRRVMKKVNKAIARHVCEHIISGILKKFEKSKVFWDLKGKLRKCAPLLHQLGETRLAIGLCTHIAKLTRELNSNLGVSELKCDLEFDKLQFQLEQDQGGNALSIQQLERPINMYKVDRFVYLLMSRVTLGNYIYFKEVVRERFTTVLLNGLSNEGSSIDLGDHTSFILMLEAEFTKIKKQKTHALKNVSFDEIRVVLEAKDIVVEEPDIMVCIRKILLVLYLTPTGPGEGKSILILKKDYEAMVEEVELNKQADYASRSYFVCLVHLALLRKCVGAGLGGELDETNDFDKLLKKIDKLDRRHRDCCYPEFVLLKARWYLQMEDLSTAKGWVDEIALLRRTSLKRYQVGMDKLDQQINEVRQLIHSAGN